MNAEFPTQGRLAGIDYGTKRIGVALTDVEQRLASPLASYERRSAQADAQYFRRLATEETISGFVVGLPLHTSGYESTLSLEARRFGDWLQETTGLPVCFYDERYTSAAAEEILGQAKLTKKRRKARVDMLAAQIMLSSYLERVRE